MDPNNEVAGVKFETDSYKAIKYYDETAAPKIIQWVMKYSGGSIKKERQAEYVLFAFVVIAIAISLFLFFGGGSGNSALKNPGLETFKNAPSDRTPVQLQ